MDTQLDVSAEEGKEELHEMSLTKVYELKKSLRKGMLRLMKGLNEHELLKQCKRATIFWSRSGRGKLTSGC
jgi:hypothetical protein